MIETIRTPRSVIDTVITPLWVPKGVRQAIVIDRMFALEGRRVRGETRLAVRLPRNVPVVRDTEIEEWAAKMERLSAESGEMGDRTMQIRSSHVGGRFFVGQEYDLVIVQKNDRGFELALISDNYVKQEMVSSQEVDAIINSSRISK